MGGDAERQPGFADFAEVGVGKVFLAEMQMLCAGDDRRAPVIVDHEFGVVPLMASSASVTICSASESLRSLARNWMVPTPSSVSRVTQATL